MEDRHDQLVRSQSEHERVRSEREEEETGEEEEPDCVLLSLATFCSVWQCLHTAQHTELMELTGNDCHCTHAQCAHPGARPLGVCTTRGANATVVSRVNPSCQSEIAGFKTDIALLILPARTDNARSPVIMPARTFDIARSHPQGVHKRCSYSQRTPLEHRG